MKLIYYSLLSTGDGFREDQLVQSVRSLRRYNHSANVFLITYGLPTDLIRREAERLEVTVCNAGDYRDHLLRRSVYGHALACNPILHKVLSLRFLPLRCATQILYLDCDTFFFGDVDDLFTVYSASHWYSREEPFSRRSPYGYNENHIDESTLLTIAEQESLRIVPPYNSGICLLNHRLWVWLLNLEPRYLEFAWRLMLGYHLHRGGGSSSEQEVRTSGGDASDSLNHTGVLPYPSSNPWILDEIALWLTLGLVPGLTHDMFRRTHVLQGGEFFELSQRSEGCIVAHYFSRGMRRFFAQVAALK